MAAVAAAGYGVVSAMPHHPICVLRYPELKATLFEWKRQHARSF